MPSTEYANCLTVIDSMIAGRAILNDAINANKRKHEVNFILVSDDVRYVDFDRVMGIPIERATLPKGVQFVVAERKVKENEK